MKFKKLYKGGDLAALLELYVFDLKHPEYVNVSYMDADTGASAVAL